MSDLATPVATIPAVTATTIIVADDDAAIRTVVRRALTRAGHAVRTTETAAGLARLIDEGVGDVVVSDVMFPDGNGLDSLPGLLARRPGLKVIVISAQNTLSTAVRATEAGAFDYLPKPFDLDELTRAVASALAATTVAATDMCRPSTPSANCMSAASRTGSSAPSSTRWTSTSQFRH